jgi:hypothetical protein
MNYNATQRNAAVDGREELAGQRKCQIDSIAFVNDSGLIRKLPHYLIHVFVLLKL